MRIELYLSRMTQESLPAIVAAAIAAHNQDVDAHKEQLKTAVDRLRLPLIGFILGTGVAGGMLLQRALTLF